MPQRLLHLSDLHLDRAFASMGCQGPLARRRRQGLRDALRRAGAIALERGCVAITLGGDLYENDRAGADTARFLVDTFEAWQPLRVFIAPGNHDALMPGSLYSRTDWPSNVHLFTGSTLAPVEVEDGLTIWGLAHREPAWQGDPLDCDPVPAEGTHIALFHGAELGSRPDGKSIHGPFHASDIRRRGFATALCGHYHKRRLDMASGLIYPGTPEPLDFSETGPRGPAIVEVADDGSVTTEALDINAWSALSIRVDVSGAASVDAVVDTALAAVGNEVGSLDPERTLVRIDLHGDVAAATSLDVFSVENHLRESTALATVRVRDATRPDVDISAAAAERTARGAFARTVLEALDASDDDEERAVLEDALRYGLMALSGAEVGLR